MQRYKAGDASLTPYTSKRHGAKLGGQFSQRFIAALAVNDSQALRYLTQVAETALWKLAQKEELDRSIREAFPDLDKDFYDDAKPPRGYIEVAEEAFSGKRA